MPPGIDGQNLDLLVTKAGEEAYRFFLFIGLIVIGEDTNERKFVSKIYQTG